MIGTGTGKPGPTSAQRPVPGKPGPRHTGDLADIVDLMLATGTRIGEILALSGEDLDRAPSVPTLTICGTLVFVKSQGFFRQPGPRATPATEGRPAPGGADTQSASAQFGHCVSPPLSWSFSLT